MAYKRRLLLVNGNQFGYSAGHYHYCKYLRDSFELHYLCFDRGRKRLSLEGVKVWYVSFDGARATRILRFVLTSIRISYHLRPDILFVVYFRLSFLLALLCPSKTKIMDIRTGSLSHGRLGRSLDNTILRFQSLMFNARVVLSEGLRESLNLRNKNTVVLPLGAEIYYAGQHQFESLKLLYVGTLDGRKICDTIEGLALYLQRNGNSIHQLSYTIVGFGSPNEERKLKDTVRRYGLEEVVSFEGRKSYDELQPYFATHNVGVAYVPITKWYQHQPMTKIFEYGLSGMFTLATSTSENARVINEVNGTLCEDNPRSFARALGYIWDRREEFDSSGIRASLADFSWRHLVEYTLEPFLLKV